MPRKLSEEGVLSRLTKEGYKLVGAYKNVRERVTLVTPQGMMWETTIGKFTEGVRFPYDKTLEYKQQFAKDKGYTLLETNNFSEKETISLLHPEGYTWRTPWSRFKYGARGKNGQSRQTPYDEVVKELDGYGYKLLSTRKEYAENCTTLKTLSPNGFTWFVSLAMFKQGRRCPLESHSSYGEKIVWCTLRNILDEKFCVDYEESITIEDRNLYFDFAIRNPKQNIIAIVEYQGKQHFEYVPLFHASLLDFYKQIYHDNLKRTYCYGNSITLIEVPYTLNNREIFRLLYDTIPNNGCEFTDFSATIKDFRTFTRRDVVEYYKGHTLQETADRYKISKWTVSRYCLSLEGPRLKEKHIKKMDPISGEVVGMFLNQSEAVRELKIPLGSLPRAIGKFTSKGNRRKCKGYFWDWVTEGDYNKWLKEGNGL